MSIINSLIDHEIFEGIDTVKISLNEIENNEGILESLDEYAIQSLNRVRAVVGHLSTLLNSIDPLLFRKNILDALNGELNYVKTELDNGEKFKVHSNLNALNSRLDVIITNSSQLAVVINEDSIVNIRETVTSFRRTAGQYRNVLEREMSDLEKGSKSILGKINDYEQTLEDYEGKIASGIKNIEDKYTELHQTFIENQETRSEQFIALKDDFKNNFNEVIEEYTNNVEESIENNIQEFSEHMSQVKYTQENFLDETADTQEEYNEMLKKHKNSVEELVGIISTNSISGHFKDVADYKRRLANRWQLTTVGSFLVTISFGFYAFVYNDVNLSWPGLISRIVVAGALASLAGYAARQASKNEFEEQKNRKMEVELKTLNPYLASFSPTDQIKLKEQLFPHIFGKEESILLNDENGNSNNTGVTLKSSDINVVQQIIELVKQLKT
ncbi:conserved hypothetical protein [Bacillus sp. 349Y]|nr:conserved hypothetical protein [Bacillus sp. 349Y]